MKSTKYKAAESDEEEDIDQFAADANACNNETDGDLYEPHTYSSSSSSSSSSSVAGKRKLHPIADDEDEDDVDDQREEVIHEDEEEGEGDNESEAEEVDDAENNDQDDQEMADVHDGNAYRRSLNVDSVNPNHRNIKGIINSSEFDLESASPSTSVRLRIILDYMRKVVASVKKRLVPPQTWNKWCTRVDKFSFLTQAVNIGMRKDGLAWASTPREIKEVFEQKEDEFIVGEGFSTKDDNDGRDMDPDEIERERTASDDDFIASDSEEIPIEPSRRLKKHSDRMKPAASAAAKTHGDVVINARKKKIIEVIEDDDDEVDDGVAEGENISTLDYAASTLPKPAAATFNQSDRSAFKTEADDHMKTNQWSGTERKFNGVAKVINKVIPKVEPKVEPKVVAKKETPVVRTAKITAPVAAAAATVAAKPKPKPVTKPVVVHDDEEEEEEEETVKPAKPKAPRSVPRKDSTFDDYASKVDYASLNFTLGTKFVTERKEYEVTHVGSTVHLSTPEANWRSRWAKQHHARVVTTVDKGKEILLCINDEGEIDPSQYSTCIEIPEFKGTPTEHCHFLLHPGHVPRKLSLVSERKIWNKLPRTEKAALEALAIRHNNFISTTMKSGRKSVRLVTGVKAFAVFKADHDKMKSAAAASDDPAPVPVAIAAAVASPSSSSSSTTQPPRKRVKQGGTFGLSAPLALADFKFAMDYEDSLMDSIINKERLRILGGRFEAVYESCRNEKEPQKAALYKLATAFKSSGVNPIQLALDFAFLVSDAYKERLEKKTE